MSACETNRMFVQGLFWNDPFRLWAQTGRARAPLMACGRITCGENQR